MSVDPGDLVMTLLARARRKREAEEALAAQIRDRVMTGLRRVVKERPHLRVWIIGSLSTGGFGHESDVDVVLEGGSLADVCAVQHVVENSSKRFADVHRLEELDGAFRDRVRAEGIPVHDQG